MPVALLRVLALLLNFTIWAVVILGVSAALAGPLTNEQAQRIFDQAFPPYLCEFWMDRSNIKVAEYRLDLERPADWTIHHDDHGLTLVRGPVRIVVNFSRGFRDGGSAVLTLRGEYQASGICERGK